MAKLRRRHKQSARSNSMWAIHDAAVDKAEEEKEAFEAFEARRRRGASNKSASPTTLALPKSTSAPFTPTTTPTTPSPPTSPTKMPMAPRKQQSKPSSGILDPRALALHREKEVQQFVKKSSVKFKKPVATPNPIASEELRDEFSQHGRAHLESLKMSFGEREGFWSCLRSIAVVDVQTCVVMLK